MEDDTDTEATPTVSLGGGGLDWRIHEALDREYVTPFVAPEQLQGNVAETTAVYQVAALAYWVLCEQPPVDATPLGRAILTGQIQRPQIANDENDRIASVLMQGLASDPTERHENIQSFYQDLRKTCP